MFRSESSRSRAVFYFYRKEEENIGRNNNITPRKKKKKSLLFSTFFPLLCVCRTRHLYGNGSKSRSAALRVTIQRVFTHYVWLLSLYFLFCFPFFFTPSISPKNDDHTSQTPSVETLERITRELRLLSLPLFSLCSGHVLSVCTYRSDGYSGGNLQFSTCRRTDNTCRIVSLF